MKKLYLFTLITMLIGVVSCSSSRKSVKTEKSTETNLKPESIVLPSDSIIKPDKLNDKSKEQEERLIKMAGFVNEQVAAYPDSLVVSWERGSCFGRCATYKVRIYKSGYAEYESVAWTDKKDGTYKSFFTKDEIKLMLEKAKESYIFEMKSFYDTDVSDLPSIFVYVNDGRNKKGIRDRRLGPKALKEFISYLDTTLTDKSFDLLFSKE